MTIIGNPSQNASPAQLRDAAPTDAGKRREAPSGETVDRFRSLMQTRGNDQGGSKRELANRFAQPAVDDGANRAAEASTPSRQRQESAAAVQGRASRGGDDPGAPGDNLPPAEAAALRHAHASQPGTPAGATPLPSINPDMFAKLIERHVRQLAVSPGGATHGDGQILLRLADATLPGTDLLLTRTADGWLLRADMHSRGSFDAIREAAPQLAERFAQRNLGTLTIEPHLHV